jgi:glycosyltransferase involved in cell wall biosynthesis
MNQTYKNIEIIVIDDCSEDNTKLYIKSLNNKSIKMLQTKKNSGGPAVPRNLGISKAKGKYIAFLDDDDSWEKNKLEICINKMQNKYDFCYHQLKQKNNRILKNHNIDITKKANSSLNNFLCSVDPGENINPLRDNEHQNALVFSDVNTLVFQGVVTIPLSQLHPVFEKMPTKLWQEVSLGR